MGLARTEMRVDLIPGVLIGVDAGTPRNVRAPWRVVELIIPLIT